MTNIAYLRHNCGSVHAVESIRKTLTVDPRTAAGYEPSGQEVMVDRRARFLRRRASWDSALGPWPGFSLRLHLDWDYRRAQAPSAPSPARLVLTHHVIRGPLCRATRIQPCSTLLRNQ